MKNYSSTNIVKHILYSVFSLSALIASTNATAQVGIGTTTPRGALEINSITSGLVPPQVALSATNVSAPVVNPQNNTSPAPASAPIVGTIVYNTATAGTNPTNVIPGYYYWTGSAWTAVTTTKGTLIARMNSSRNSDLPIGIAVTDIIFDTDDLAASGTISRTGGVFTILTGGDGIYTFALQPQVTISNAGGDITFWAEKNGIAVANSGARNSSTGAGDTQVVPLIITLKLVAGDTVSFKAIHVGSGTYILDYTAAASPVPAIPAAIIDVRGYKDL